eukprot:7391037-Prymnesium_polylepis.1
MIIQSDSLPTIKALIEMLKTKTDFFGGDSPAVFSGIGVRAGKFLLQLRFAVPRQRRLHQGAGAVR